MEKLLSIVVPVYNVEKYINKCLESLAVSEEQMAQLEVLVVNDGTPDNSAIMAKEFEKKYPQTFRVIDKENGGHGSCCNLGLKEAHGKYIHFLDSDDWLLPGALRSLYDYIQKGYDIVKTRPCRSDGVKYWTESYPVNSGEIIGNTEYAEKMIFNLIHPYLHSGIYRRSLFTEGVFRSISEAGKYRLGSG